MPNLAYKIEVAMDDKRASRQSVKGSGNSEVCAACGEQLFGPDAQACSWQAWGTFWEILGLSNVDLVCGSCGEYLREIFRSDRK